MGDRALCVRARQLLGGPRRHLVPASRLIAGAYLSTQCAKEASAREIRLVNRTTGLQEFDRAVKVALDG